MNMNRAKCGIMSQLLKEVNAMSFWTWEVCINGVRIGWIDKTFERGTGRLLYSCTGRGLVSVECTDFMKALSKFIPNAINRTNIRNLNLVGSVGCFTNNGMYFTVLPNQLSENNHPTSESFMHLISLDIGTSYPLTEYISAFELNYGILTGAIEIAK